MTILNVLLEKLYSHCTGFILEHHDLCDEITLIIDPSELKKICLKLRDISDLSFEQLIDLTVIDYLHYGQVEWQTQNATSKGFDRGVLDITLTQPHTSPFQQRFCVVYHLLSLAYNQRLRLKVFLDEKNLEIISVTDIWPSANWFEREAFDLFGVYFYDHPDLRRILTDYGFVGHPLRKDFPVSGHVEVRYDAEQERVIYEPVDIQPRTLVPKVIRGV